MVLIDLLNAGFPQNLFVKNAISAKCNKAKHNKTRYACRMQTMHSNFCREK